MKKLKLEEFSLEKTDISRVTGGICKCKIRIPGGDPLPPGTSWGTSSQSRIPKPTSEDAIQ